MITAAIYYIVTNGLYECYWDGVRNVNIIVPCKRIFIPQNLMFFQSLSVKPGKTKRSPNAVCSFNLTEFLRYVQRKLKEVLDFLKTLQKRTFLRIPRFPLYLNMFRFGWLCKSKDSIFLALRDNTDNAYLWSVLQPVGIVMICYDNR